MQVFSKPVSLLAATTVLQLEPTAGSDGRTELQRELEKWKKREVVLGKREGTVAGTIRLFQEQIYPKLSPSQSVM